MEGKAYGGGRVLPSTRLQMLDGDNAALTEMPFQPEPAHITPTVANTCRVGLAGGQTQRWNLVDLDVKSLHSGLRLSPPWICFYSWHRPPFMLPSRRVDIIHASDPRLDAGSVVAPSFFVFKPMLCCVDFLCQD